MSEFCGTSIKISVKCPDNKIVLIIGSFSLDDDTNSEFHIDHHITKDILLKNEVLKESI